MNKTVALIWLALLSLSGCKGSHQDVVDERNEAQREISGAQDRMNAVERQAMDNIAAAQPQGPEAVQEQKVEATQAIAAAEKELDDEKVEATREITEAQVDAGETDGSYRRE